MIKHIYLLAALLCLGMAAKAQDQLYKKDNTKLTVKVLEIGAEEVKYKMYDNLEGPTYTENKSAIDLIIYANGQHQMMNAATTSSAAPAPVTVDYKDEKKREFRKDSALFFKHSNSISINFLNFFNNEVGLIYQHDFFRKQFCLVVPVAFGVEKPNITQSVYFNGYNYGSDGRQSNYIIDHKLFEAGIGAYYYPSLSGQVNYFIGPVFRYMQYAGTQHASYYGYNGYNYGSYFDVSKNTTLSRYCVSITNGMVVRTKSRISLSLFGSLGFKSDHINDPVTDPTTNTTIKSVNHVSLYFWSGFSAGFSF